MDFLEFRILESEVVEDISSSLLLLLNVEPRVFSKKPSFIFGY